MTTALGVPTINVRAIGQTLRVAHRPARNDRPPLLLFNGFGCSAEVFEPLVAALDPDTGVVCIDPPGIGGSPPPRVPYRLSSFGTRVGRVLDELGVAFVDTLGVSWGGAMAQQFAVQNPRRCRRLVLVSTAAAPLLRPSLATLREVVRPRRFDPVHGRQIAASLYGGRVREDPSLLRVLQREIPNRGGELFQQLALAGWTSLPYLRMVRQDTLVVAGARDALVPMINTRILRALLPHATVHIFDDGHLGLLTSAAEVAPVIETFLSTPSPRRSQ
jgi:poly(3-hydroxyalkanoate) depolymerase